MSAADHFAQAAQASNRDSNMQRPLDPVLVEVIKNEIAALTEEMRPHFCDVYFDRVHGLSHTPVLRRGEISGSQSGPMIIEEPDTTGLLLPGWSASLVRMR